eukprot:g10792.t1
MTKRKNSAKTRGGGRFVRKRRALHRPGPLKNNRRAKPGERTQQAARFYQNKACPTAALICFTHVKRFAAKFLEANAEDFAVGAAGEEDDQTDARADWTTVRLKEAAALQLLQSSEDVRQKLASASEAITYARKSQALQMPGVVAAKAIRTSRNRLAMKDTKTGEMTLVMPGGRGGAKTFRSAKLDPCATWDSGSKRLEERPSCSGLTMTPHLRPVEEEESSVLSDDDDSDGSAILAPRGGCAEEQLETERVRDDTSAVLGPYLLKKEHSLISPDENCAFIRQGKLSRLQVQSVVRRALECAKSVSADTTAAARHLIDDLYDTSEAYESKPHRQLQLPAPCYGKIPVQKENVLAYLRQGEVVANTYLFGFAVSTTGAPKSSTTARLPRDELRGFGAERSAAEEDHEDAARGMLEASYNALRNKGRGERALISGVWLSTAFAEKLALRVECLVGALLRRLAAFQNWRIQGEAKVVLGPGGGGGAAGSFGGAPAGVAAGGSSGVSSGASRGPPSTRERKGVRALADPVEDEQAEADEEADEQSQMRMFLTQHAGPMLTQEQEDHGMQTDGGTKSKRTTTTNKTTGRADRNEQDHGRAPVDTGNHDQPTTSTSAISITVPLHALATFFVSDVLRLYLPLLQLGAEGAEFLQDKSSELEEGIFVSGAARDHMDAAGTTDAGLHKAETGLFVDPERQAKGKCAEAPSAALAWIDRRVGFVTDGLMRPGSAVDHAAPDSCCTCSLRAVFRDRGTLEAVLQRAFKGFQGTAGTSTVLKPAKQNRQHPFWEAMATLQQVSSLTFSKQLHENAKIEQTLRSWDLRISPRVQELVDNHAEYEKALDAAPPTATTATDDLFWQRKMIRDARQDRDIGVREVIKSRGPVLAQLWEEELSEAFARVERWERFAREFLLRREPLRTIDPAHAFRLAIARNRVLSDCATTAEKQLVADFEAGRIFHPRFKYGDFSLLAAGGLKNFFHANFNLRNVPIFGGEELGAVQTPQTSGGVLSVAYRHRTSLHHWTGVWAGVLPGLSAMARIGEELLAAVTGSHGVSNDASLLPELRKVSAVLLHGTLMADELLATFMHKANLLEVGGGGAEVAPQHGRFDFLSMNRLSFMQILQPVLYGTLRNSVHNLATNDHYLAPDGGTAKQQTKDLPIALEQVLGFAARAREAMRWREDPNSRGWFFWALVLERFPGQDETLRTKFLNLLLCEDGATYLSNADLVQEAGNVAFDTAFGLGDEQFSSLAVSVAAALPQSHRFGEERGTPPGWDEAAALERLLERLQDMALSEREAKSLVWMGKTSNWSTEFEPRFGLIFHTAEAKKRAHASWRLFLEARVKTPAHYGRLDANGVDEAFDPPRPVRKSPTMLARELGVRKQEFEQKGAGYELQAEALAVAERAMERLEQELESRGSSLLKPGLSFPNFAETVNLAQRLPDFQLAFLVWVQPYLLIVIIFFRMLRSAATKTMASGSSGRGGGGCGNGNAALLFQALQAGGALQQGLRAAGNTAAQLLDAAEETVTQLERFGVVGDRNILAWKDDDNVHVDDHAYAAAGAALPRSIVVTGRQKAQQEIWDVSNLSAKLHRQLHALCVFLIDALADKANIHEFAYAVGDPARWRKTPIEMRRYVFDTSDEGRAAKKRLLSSSAGGKNKPGVKDTPGYFYVRWDEMGRQVTWRSDGGDADVGRNVESLGRGDEGVVLLKSPLDPSKRDAAVEIQFSEVGLLPDGQSCGNREFEYGFFDESGGTDWATDCVVFLADVGNRQLSKDTLCQFGNEVAHIQPAHFDVSSRTHLGVDLFLKILVTRLLFVHHSKQRRILHLGASTTSGEVAERDAALQGTAAAGAGAPPGRGVVESRRLFMEEPSSVDENAEAETRQTQTQRTEAEMKTSDASALLHQKRMELVEKTFLSSPGLCSMQPLMSSGGGQQEQLQLAPQVSSGSSRSHQEPQAPPSEHGSSVLLPENVFSASDLQNLGRSDATTFASTATRRPSNPKSNSNCLALLLEENQAGAKSETLTILMWDNYYNRNRRLTSFSQRRFGTAVHKKKQTLLALREFCGTFPERSTAVVRWRRKEVRVHVGMFLQDSAGIFRQLCADLGISGAEDEALQLACEIREQILASVAQHGSLTADVSLLLDDFQEKLAGSLPPPCGQSSRIVKTSFADMMLMLLSKGARRRRWLPRTYHKNLLDQMKMVFFAHSVLDQVSYRTRLLQDQA